jgi:excisionase family DNA binding protein
MPTPTIEPYALSPKAAATFCGLGLTRIKALIRDGVLPIRKDGRRTLILRADLEAYIASLSTGRLALPRDACGKFAGKAVRP